MGIEILAKRNKWVKIFLVLAILTSFVVRFWRISSLSFPPNGDEVAFGYYGWSLLHFGTDEYGKFLPLNFSSIGDFKYPGLAYLNTIPAALFGLTEITTRFWDALSGVVLVPLVFLLSILIFSSPIAAVVSAWLVALSPWSIIESRLGYENHIAMVLTTAAIVCLLISRRRKLLIAVSFILFLISSFTYGAQRIFIPLILLSLLIISFLRGIKLKINRKVVLVFLFTIGLVIFISLLSSSNRGRASAEIWSGLSPDENNHLQEVYVQAGISPVKVPARITWFFHNKYKVAVIDFAIRYLDYFSPRFLFFHGGEYSLEKIPDMGLLLFIELLLLPVGILAILQNPTRRRFLIIVAWLLIAPIASALTSGGPHINRASIMIVPIALTSGYGFAYISGLFKRRARQLAVIVVSAGIVVSSLYALNQIFIQKPVDRPWFKEQVNKELTLEILKLKDRYKAVVTGGDDYIFFLFYGKISPNEFLQRSQIRPVSSGNNWERVDRLDNIYFKMPFNCPKTGKLNVLYVCSGEEIPQNSKVIKVFYYLDGVPAYSLVEFYPESQMPSPLPKTPDRFKYMVEIERTPIYPDGIIPDDFSSFW